MGDGSVWWKVTSVFESRLWASHLAHLVRNLFFLVPFLENTNIKSQRWGCSCQSPLLFTSTAQTDSATHISLFLFHWGKNHKHLSHPRCCCSWISFSKPSAAALLPLFVKTEMMREEHVSSFYVALCLSKKTWAAPWQLTTHSWLTNATEPPKRPLFNVTRWHCVMQAKT